MAKKLTQLQEIKELKNNSYFDVSHPMDNGTWYRSHKVSFETIKSYIPNKTIHQHTTEIVKTEIVNKNVVSITKNNVTNHVTNIYRDVKIESIPKENQPRVAGIPPNSKTISYIQFEKPNYFPKYITEEVKQKILNRADPNDKAGRIYKVTGGYRG